MSLLVTATPSDWLPTYFHRFFSIQSPLPPPPGGIDYTEAEPRNGKQIITSAVGKYVAATYQHNQQQIPGHAWVQLPSWRFAFVKEAYWQQVLLCIVDLEDTQRFLEIIYDL